MTRMRRVHKNVLFNNEFYQHYKENVENPLPQSIYAKVFKEMWKVFSDMLLDNYPVKINDVGVFYIIEYFPTSSRIRVDFNGCWKLWESQHPELSRQEIKKIPNKTVVYHTNEHSNGARYYLKWKRKTGGVTAKKLMKLQISKKMKLRISAAVKEGKTFNSYR
jgi:hypothetical protein